MKGRQRSKETGTGFVYYEAIHADPNGTRAQRRAWAKQFGKRPASSSAPAPTSEEPDTQA